jgi:hypothetical protein
MPKQNEIRADYDGRSIVVYQAYSSQIALPALEAQRFVPPFSFGRMTWIKPSFLWLMERSNWGQKSGQEHIIAVRIARAGWDKALACGALTSYEAGVHRNIQEWQTQFQYAHVHVQWDPERSLRGADVGYNSIQVGISRHLIREFVDEWIIEIEDLTPRVRKIHSLLVAGKAEHARKLLPTQRPYPVVLEVAKRLKIGV